MDNITYNTLLELINSSSIYNEMRKDSTLLTALAHGVNGLKPYCHMPLVAQFANLTLFILPRNTIDTAEDSGVTPPFNVRVLLSIIFILVGFIGIIGNSLTVLVIYKTTSLHSHTNYFLASLAISDLCLIVVGVPYDMMHLWKKHHPPHIAGYCAFMSTSISLFTFASILTIVSLTAERFVAICYPFGHRTIFHKRRVINLIYSIWVIAFFPSVYIGFQGAVAFFIFHFFFHGAVAFILFIFSAQSASKTTSLQFKRVVPDFCGYNRELGTWEGICDYATSDAVPFTYPFELIMVVTFVLPLIFIVYCYVRILGTLNEMAHQTTVHVPVGTTNSDSSQMITPTSAAVLPPSILYVHTKNYAPPKSQQAQRMVIKMLVTVTAVFFICYLPYHIERLIVQYTKAECDKSMFCLLLYPITGLLQYISATLNPVFYNLMSTRFRTAFNNLIQSVLPKRESKQYSLARM